MFKNLNNNPRFLNAHALISAVRPPYSNPYRFTLRHNDTRSIPRISAALVLLPPVCSKIQLIYSFSLSSRVRNSRFCRRCT